MLGKCKHISCHLLWNIPAFTSAEICRVLSKTEGLLGKILGSNVQRAEMAIFQTVFNFSA